MSMGRFINPIEMKYDKTFKDNDPYQGSRFYIHDREKEYFTLLVKAIKRGTPLTKKELIKLVGGNERYLYILEWHRLEDIGEIL